VVMSPGPDGPPRVGFLVSRSCGTAVKRNRIKRRLRSAAESVELQPGTDYVIIATDQVAQVPYRQIVNWLGRALEESANA
jgi:ribonuclease P protein component